MEVSLYVYDLSKGLARQMSQQFLGIQIDAVYHTAIVLEGIEYFFGAGIQTTRAGTTHHGRPIEVVSLGKTELPIELTLEYLESLRKVYSVESYDLFLHNCNNFSHDFAMFLVGKGIPEHITQLPQTVLNTPFGQMLRPYLDQSMRSITQAPVAPQVSAAAKQTASGSRGSVRNIVSLQKLEQALQEATESCAIVFFTSSTCGPCKLLYPTYDELAQEAGSKATLIKVDINFAEEIASSFKVRATPTILTFLKGKKEEEWSGADVQRLKSSVEYLIRVAHPAHPHARLSARHILVSASTPVKYTKFPPLEKLTPKLAALSKDESLLAMTSFLAGLNGQNQQENPVPDLPAFAEFMDTCTKRLPIDCVFAAYDVLRIALIDPRICAFFAEKKHSTRIANLVEFVNDKGEEAPYNLRIVTLHLCCNFLSGPLAKHLAGLQVDFLATFTQLVITNLLDKAHVNVRVAAASLAFNLAAAHHNACEREQTNGLSSDQQIELVAAAVEALENENDSAEAATGLLLTLALMLYLKPADSALVDLCEALDIPSIVASKAKFVLQSDATKEAIAILTTRLHDQHLT